MRIKADLEKRGHRVWIDEQGIKSGDHWREKITDGILNSSNLLGFLSRRSVRNPGVCLDELRIALCIKGSHIKTVLLESENVVQPPPTICDIQWLDMSRWKEIRKTRDADVEKS